MTLPNTGNELKVLSWVPGTPKQFLLHVRTAFHVCKQLDLETKEAMMALEAANCKLDAIKADHAKLAKSAKEKAKDMKEKEETPAPESKKKAKEPQEQTNILAPDIIANIPTLATAKKACKEATKKVKEAKLSVTIAGSKAFE